MPLCPFFIFAITPFRRFKIFPVYNAAPIFYYRRIHNMQAFVIDDSGNRVRGAIRKIIAAADANQMKIFSRCRVLKFPVITESAFAIAPCNASGQSSLEIILIDFREHFFQIVKFTDRTNGRGPASEKFFTPIR